MKERERKGEREKERGGGEGEPRHGYYIGRKTVTTSNNLSGSTNKHGQRHHIQLHSNNQHVHTFSSRYKMALSILLSSSLCALLAATALFRALHILPGPETNM